MSPVLPAADPCVQVRIPASLSTSRRENREEYGAESRSMNPARAAIRSAPDAVSSGPGMAWPAVWWSAVLTISSQRPPSPEVASEAMICFWPMTKAISMGTVDSAVAAMMMP